MKKFAFAFLITVLLIMGSLVVYPVGAERDAGTFQANPRKPVLFTKAKPLNQPINIVNEGLSKCEPDGIQPSGAIYRICMPTQIPYNNQLVIWAHGFVPFNEPLVIPEDQLCFDGSICIPTIVNALGFGFATTSYRMNGLTILPGLVDIQELIMIYIQQKGLPEYIFIVGASEGGLITALSLERYPDVFDGGVAMCGPIGDFRRQINYYGDFHVIFNYFFPNLIDSSIVTIPDKVIAGWDELWNETIWPIVSDPANFHKVEQLLAVTNAPYLASDLVPGSLGVSVKTTIHDGLWYNVFATNETIVKLGGLPYENLSREYTGSDNDEMLNRLVARLTPDAKGLESILAYQTDGAISDPMVTMHTVLDQQVAYWHELLYEMKVQNAGTQQLHVNLPINRYGHCEFTPVEALVAFAIMYQMATDEPLDSERVHLLLPDPADQANYLRLLELYGN